MNLGPQSAITSPRPREPSSPAASLSAPHPKKIDALEGARLGTTGIPIPSSLPKIPGWIYHLRRGLSPQRDTQLLTYPHISSHVIPPGARDSWRKFFFPPALARLWAPIPSRSYRRAWTRWVKQMRQQMRKSSAPSGRGRDRPKKAERDGQRENRFFFWRWSHQEAARQSRCEPGCAGSRPFPWGLFPKQQQQIGCRFQAGWGNKRKSNQNPLTAEIKGDQRPNTQSAPSSYHSHDGGCFAFRL